MTERPAPCQRQDVAAAASGLVLDGDLLASCVHCGFCLEACPTYRLSGDENNSPRGRLRLWKEEAQRLLPADRWTDHYTRQCVGCLACETACPAAVPYGQILQQVRRQQVVQRRTKSIWPVRLADFLVRRPGWANLAATPVRALRRWGLLTADKWFPGRPAVWQSTADYARQLMQQHRPSGPRVALFTGCLMEAAFREINFASVRLLVRNNFQVIVPSTQTCCGALQHHIGSGGTETLSQCNRQAFSVADVDLVVTNSSGCGLELARTLAGVKPVCDIIDLLEDAAAAAAEGDAPTTSRSAAAAETPQVYLDLPCHRLHGSRNQRIPHRLLDATGLPWQLAPQADQCCGAGGVYHLEQPQTATEILRHKAEFMQTAPAPGDAHAPGRPHQPLVLVTLNHVCMMQWHRAVRQMNRQQPGRWVVQHLVQLLDQTG